MKKILFVDDEPNVLQGLKRMLWPLRNQWDMEFVESGKKALEFLEKVSFDVVVSDMRMPGMNGADLLTDIMNKYPNIVRIILSGHSDGELILRSVGPTHQYLAKPCDADTLKDTITRACALRELLADKKLQELVAHIKSLPSLPAFYVEILEEVSKPDSSIKKVGEIISKDVGMTAKTLQLINSAFFGLPCHVSSPAQAVNLLGLDTIKALVLSIQIFSQFDGADVNKQYIDFLFHHSIAVGAYARIISVEEKVEQKMKDDVSVAGMLHDVGSLVLAQNLRDKYTEALKHAKEQNMTMSSAESEIIGGTHAEVGAYLLGLWGFPDPVIEALAFHHCPSKCLSQAFCPLTAVHVANILDQENNPVQAGAPPEIDMKYLEELNLTGRLSSWRKCCLSVSKEKQNE